MELFMFCFWLHLRLCVGLNFYMAAVVFIPSVMSEKVVLFKYKTKKTKKPT